MTERSRFAEIDRYVFPPELQRPAPRTTVRRPGTLKVTTVIGRVLWVGIAVIGLYTIARVPIYALVVYRGNLIEGRVESTNAGKNRYDLYYSFEAAGARQEDHREISKALYDQFKHGQKIPVLVRSFAGAPFSVVLFPEDAKFSIVFDAIMIALMWNFMLTLLVGYLFWISYWLEKRLCQRGTAVIGRIIRKNISRRRATYYELHYEFEHPRLGLKNSQSLVVPSQYEKAREDETVTVLCNPQRFEHSSTVYEYGNFMCL